MEISSEHQDYLKRKHTGGVSNTKGNNYESIYATKEIVRLFAEENEEETTKIGTQLENKFVDDLIIIEKEKKIYSQLKNKKNLSWGGMKYGELLFDFTYQQFYSKEGKEMFSLKIVYSDLNSPLHTEDIPPVLKEVVVKEHFPYYESLTYLLQTNDQIREWLGSIMSYPGEIFPLDMQSASLECIRGQWLELSQPNRMISLKEIKEAYQKKHPDCPNFKNALSVSIPIEVNEILDKIEGFEYTYSGSSIYWKWRRITGESVITPEKVNLLLKTPPSTFFELLSCLN